VIVRGVVARGFIIFLLTGCGGGMRPLARNAGDPLLYVEVADSIGLPLPDAKLEVYTLMDRAVFREWVFVDPSDLPDGIHLLRFSHPGYRPSVFSVPLRTGARVSLRVRLGAERDTTNRGRTEAIEVRAIGRLMEGRASSDIIKARRVLDRDLIEQAHPSSIADVLRDAKGMGVMVLPGEAMIRWVGAGGVYGCPLPVMINGDRRFLNTFTDVSQRYRPEDVEAIELVPRTAALLYPRRPDDVECALLAFWVRDG
jgi:hypothetical protein